MPAAPRFSAVRVAAVAREVLGAGLGAVEHVPVGWGNENWRVVTDEGASFLVKISDPVDRGKVAATRGAYDRAEAAGVPTPRLVRFDPACERLDGWTVRVLTWVEGRNPVDVLTGREATDRFFAGLGGAVAALHGEEEPAFSSRLDGSKPRFERWDGYVAYRLPQVVERARSGGRFADDELDGMAAEIRDLAALVSPAVRPALCHRDLHLDNLLARPDGSLAAVLDFDSAEPWDPAVDVVKLRWLVFPRYEGAEAAFDRTYFGAGGRPARWDERVRLVDLLELVNTVANADGTGDPTYEGRARARLAAVRGQ
jgi:aminoglycoside phosphotransferase (APT) family kinase protein